MKKTALFAIIILLLSSCGPCRRLHPTMVRDSVRVEYRERIEYIHDTITIEIPKEIFVNMTRDTTSHIETSVASSDAIVSDGILTHMIENKAVALSAETISRIVYRDSIIYRDKDVEKVVQVEKPLTKWQRAKMGGFWVLLVSLVGIAAVRLFLRKFKL